MKNSKALYETYLESLKGRRKLTQRVFPSKSKPGTYHIVIVYYGGSMIIPPLMCDCKQYEYKHWCLHCERTWSDLDHISKRFATEPYVPKTNH